MYDISENNVLCKAEFSVVPNLLKIPTASLFQHSAGALSAISYAKFVCNKVPFGVWMNLNLLVKCKLSIALGRKSSIRDLQVQMCFIAEVHRLGDPSPLYQSGL